MTNVYSVLSQKKVLTVVYIVSFLDFNRDYVYICMYALELEWLIYCFEFYICLNNLPLLYTGGAFKLVPDSLRKSAYLYCLRVSTSLQRLHVT